MMNESWGVPRLYDNTQQQHFARSLYHLAHGLDPSRLVIANDGWEMTENDICAFHSYKHGSPDNPGFPKICVFNASAAKNARTLVQTIVTTASLNVNSNDCMKSLS